jgi:hypothetical protein
MKPLKPALLLPITGIFIPTSLSHAQTSMLKECLDSAKQTHSFFAKEGRRKSGSTFPVAPDVW